MKKKLLTTEKTFPRRLIKKNKESISDIKEYQKVLDILKKSSFNYGQNILYKEVGASTTGELPVSIYGTITTG